MMANSANLRNLTQKEILILMKIQENPLATYEELAQTTDLPKTQVFRIVKKLEDPSLKPPYFRIVAVPDLNFLGLEHLEVLVEAETKTEIDKCAGLCEEHPYIWYYTKCFGKINGFFIQFQIPVGKIDLISSLFNIMKAKGWIRSFDIIHFNTDSILTKTLVKNWDLDTLSWNFKWDDWLKLDFLKNPNLKIKKSQPNIEEKYFLQVDLAILSELMRNSRRKHKDIIEFLNSVGWKLTAQSFSIRMKNIENTLIKGFRAEIKSESFDLLNTVLIVGYGESDFINEIRQRILDNPIPYYSTLKTDNYKIFWYIHISNKNLSDLLNLIRPFLHNLQFYYIDRHKSETFLLDPMIYDEKNKKWLDNENFLIYDVLKKLE